MKYFNEMNLFCEKLGINFNIDMYNKFIIYMENLIEYNKNVNLTSILEEEKIINRHFLDSLTIFNYKLDKYSSLCDVGTGAGFPGIPIKILRDDLEITLIESTNKKVVFLKTIIDKLNLKNIKIICSRVEDVSRETLYREKFNYVTSRAMARLNMLLELSFPLLKVGGKYIALKGIKAVEELRESSKIIDLLGGKMEKKIELKEFNSNLIVINKIKSTPKEFPRQYSKILNNKI